MFCEEGSSGGEKNLAKGIQAILFCWSEGVMALEEHFCIKNTVSDQKASLLLKETY